MLVRNLIFDRTRIPLLNKALNVSALRNRAISNNIANINTVNYKRKEVDFASYLRSQVVKPTISGKRTDGRHMLIGNVAQKAPRIYQPDPGPNVSGVNNVDIDMEMSALAENHLLYNISIRLIAGAFQGIRKSISGQVRA
ncbi:MAG: flagellar basal body rod protein FlgB [bacterium]|nr:flagellar basal body rod protein FlgB [bacterium]